MRQRPDCVIAAGWVTAVRGIELLPLEDSGVWKITGMKRLASYDSESVVTDIEQRVAKLEAFNHELYALAMLTSRIALDILGRQVKAGQLTPEEAKRWIEIAAEQVGEGAPHLELAARTIAQAICTKVPTGPEK